MVVKLCNIVNINYKYNLFIVYHIYTIYILGIYTTIHYTYIGGYSRQESDCIRDTEASQWSSANRAAGTISIVCTISLIVGVVVVVVVDSTTMD